MEYSKDLAEKLFKNSKIQDINHFIAPMSMLVFCHEIEKGFIGDKLKGMQWFGIPAKFCNDFFPTPTDLGLCMTRNLDIKVCKYQNHSIMIINGQDLSGKGA